MKSGQVFLLLCALCICGTFAAWYPSTEDALEYLRGSTIPDFNASIYEHPIRMKYQMTNSVIVDLTGDEAYYDLSGTGVKLRLYSNSGHIKGDIKALITSEDDDTLNYPIDGTFKLHAVRSNFNVTVVFPKVSGKTALELTSCEASYESLNLTLVDKHIKDPDDLSALSYWLTRALHKTLSELYCKGFSADMAKGWSSTVVQALVGNIMLEAFKRG